jgi:hypothetical protein
MTEHKELYMSATVTALNPKKINNVNVKQQSGMSVKWFDALSDHPRQRDTERHATYASQKHLKAYSATHSSVSVATFDGVTYKLDGHTRAFLWKNGTLKAPTSLEVTFYECDTEEDFLEIYTHFDNKFAVENTQDILSGALHSVGIKISSPSLRSYNFSRALQFASRAFGPEVGNAYANVQTFAAEIALLDKHNINSPYFKSGVIVGLLLCLRKHGSKVIPFIEALNNNRGIKTATTYDGVQALIESLEQLKNKKSNGHKFISATCAKTVSCVENYIKGVSYKVTPKGVSVKETDITKYL